MLTLRVGELIDEVGEHFPLQVGDVEDSPELDAGLVPTQLGQERRGELRLTELELKYLEEKIIIEVPPPLPVLSAGLEGW